MLSTTRFQLRLITLLASVLVTVIGCGGGSSASPTSPTPGDLSGTYRGSFRIDTVTEFRNTSANGTVTLRCTFNIALVGTLVIDVENRSGGQVSAHLAANWSESEVSRTCPFASGTALQLSSGLDFQGPPAALLFNRSLSGPGGGSLTVTRTEGFTGAISGGTITGSISRSFSATGPIPNAEQHFSGYPVSSVAVTLTRS
jgi:hypothetical protein